VDELYNDARAAGALGGKLTGAGGGGFMLLFVEPHNRARVRERLNRLLHIPFRFTSSGSEVIFFEPEADYSAEERDRVTRNLQPFRELVPDSPGTAIDMEATPQRPPGSAGGLSRGP